MAEALGSAIAEAGHHLVYGGGNVGLMGIVANAVLAGGGDVIGVITEQLLALEVGHDGLTELEVLPDMHARKARMAELADGIVVLPGGFGTYEEAFEVLGISSASLVRRSSSLTSRWVTLQRAFTTRYSSSLRGQPLLAS